MNRTGYDENFLEDNRVIPLPSPSLGLSYDVLHRDQLKDNKIADYVHFSIVMSKSNKQALFSAANLDQSRYRSVEGRNWFVDPRIGIENQIGPEAYTNNVWDRGHLTRRTAVTWGDDSFIAKNASNDSCSYANSSLQHANFNQDEWRVPEEIVRYFKKDKNDKLCIFTGPIFTDTDRWYTKRELNEPVRIPSGFWKVVAYIDKETDIVECQAYTMYQDELFIRDKRGRHRINVRNYQVTITEIEALTGLEFPKILFDANPLYYYPRKNEEGRWINKGPEGLLVGPRGLSEGELKKGVAFTRSMVDSSSFRNRRRVLRE